MAIVAAMASRTASARLRLDHDIDEAAGVFAGCRQGIVDVFEGEDPVLENLEIPRSAPAKPPETPISRGPAPRK
jgi:hypothetical protein